MKNEILQDRIDRANKMGMSVYLNERYQTEARARFRTAKREAEEKARLEEAKRNHINPKSVEPVLDPVSKRAKGLFCCFA